jgi:PIN domain nuclease of toxin-antitoxin system
VSLLLDTHTALWYALGEARLSAAARAAIEAEAGQRFISPASYWEIAIKIRLGKYTLTVPFQEFWRGAIERCGYTILPIELRHAESLTTLPFVHRDPFDRMIVAQALCDDLTLVGGDSVLDGYGVRRVW